jgi:hypothetical protein
MGVSPMSIKRNKKLLAAILVCGAGTVFQALPNGCVNYLTQQVLAGFNTCAVLNCAGGTFFNFCTPVRLLVDCPTTTTTTQ